MKNMVLLVDTNVALDLILVRQPQYDDVKIIADLCKKEKAKGYVAFHSVSTIWYLLRKFPVAERRPLLLQVTNFFEVIAAPHFEVVNAAKNEKFPDFEDCLQEKCAVTARADIIVTSNIKDFKTSSIPAMTPADVLEMFRAEGLTLNES